MPSLKDLKVPSGTIAGSTGASGDELKAISDRVKILEDEPATDLTPVEQAISTEATNRTDADKGLSDRLESANNIIDAHTTDIAAVKLKNTEQDEIIESLQIDAEKTNIDLDLKTEQIEELRVVDDTLTFDIAAIKAVNDTQAAKLSDLQSQSNDRKSSIDGLDNSLAYLDERLTKADAALSTRIDTANTAIADRALQTDLTALTARVTSAETVNSTQDTEIADRALQTDLTALTTTVGNKAAQADLTALTTRITATETVNGEQATAIASKAAQTDLTTLATAVGTKATQTDLTALTTRVTAAETKNTSQDTAIASKAAQADLASLQSTVRDLDLATSEQITDVRTTVNDTAAFTTTLNNRLTAVETALNLIKSIDAWTTGSEINSKIKFGTKDIFVQCWSGTAPANGNDNTLFTISGCTEVIYFHGKFKESNSSRVNAIEGAHSGSTAHGQMFKFYGNEGHFMNSTGDTRFSGVSYLVKVWYVK